MPLRLAPGRRTVALGAIVVVAGLALAGAVIDTANPSSVAQTGPFGLPHGPENGGLVGWVLAKQATFYRQFSGLIRAAKTDGTTVWTLLGISFLYGAFHAAGPGHGKAVISSYLVANEETWRRGVTLSFASALLQALTAVALVGIAAGFLGATGPMMTSATRVIETASYALIALIGARLVYVKGRAFIEAWRGTPAHGEAHQHDHCGHAPAYHHAHDHGHDGHAHGPEPQQLAGAGGWRRGLAAIVAVGLRPCSGAILVLVFALAQGLFWAGVISTFVMGLGTAITVALIATLAVSAKDLARRLAAHREGAGALTLRGIETLAAALVLLFGLALLAGYMQTERIFG
jgi:ABC-type nickel/cobalt efflux system permease component RcnA